MPSTRPEQTQILPCTITVPGPTKLGEEARWTSADQCDCKRTSTATTTERTPSYDSDSTWSCTTDEESSSYDYDDDSSISSIESPELHHCPSLADSTDFVTTISTTSTASGRRRVHFAEHVLVREYSVTIGDVPLCRDSCPLTLDWSYRTRLAALKRSPPRRRRKIIKTSSYTNSNDDELTLRRLTDLYVARHGLRQPRVRRLSLEQRRERIATVQNLSREQVRAMEIERVLERISDAIHLGEVLAQQFDETAAKDHLGDEYKGSLGDHHHSQHQLMLANVLGELESVASTWSSELRSEAAFCRTRRNTGGILHVFEDDE